MSSGRPARGGGRRNLRPLLCALLGAAALAGCGDGSAGRSAGPPAARPMTLLQSARSGSFLPAGGGMDLVLRGVGGTTAIDTAAPAGGAGSIATSKLFEHPGPLLGEGPLEGTFSSVEINQAQYWLRLSDPRYEGVLDYVRWRAEILGGQPESVPGSFGAATLEIEVPGATLVISGLVSDSESAQPLGGSLVTLKLDGSEALLTAITDDAGRYDFAGLPPGRYTLEASLPGYERDSGSVDAGPGSELDLALVSSNRQ